MNAPELKPCPFCGEADPQVLLVQHMEGTILHPTYRVICDNCGGAAGWTDRGDHVEEWNRRADLYDAQAAEIADLRRQLAEARGACNQSRLAFAGLVSVDSALRKLDALEEAAK